MNQEIVESVHKAIVPGEYKDMYYPGEENIEKQAFGQYQENRYVAAVPSLNFGSSSTVLFNPTEGLSDIVLTLELPAATYTGLGLNQGWGYQCIRQMGIRIGNSSLYYFTGDELFLANLSDAEDSAKRDLISSLGGQACLTADFASAEKRRAYVAIKCPWNTVSAQEKGLPLPTDLLTSPIQFIIEFEQASKVFVQAATSPAPTLPTGFASAEMCFRQHHLMNGGDSLARRVNICPCVC